jgi:hypothetical protein
MDLIGERLALLWNHPGEARGLHELPSMRAPREPGEALNRHRAAANDDLRLDVLRQLHWRWRFDGGVGRIWEELSLD